MSTIETEAAPPPAPPPPVLPARSAVAAALLNLTGLGLGYGYLRRWVLAGAALAGTVALAAVAFAVGAADQPWLWRAIAVGWLGMAALHAGLLARRHPRPAGRPVAPVAAGAVAVALVVAAYVGYGALGRGAYADAVAAQARADCATAVDGFDTVTGPFALTLSADVAAARARRAQCAVYTEGVAAQRRGDHEAAVRSFRRVDDPALTPFVHDDLAESYLALGTGWTAPLDVAAARGAVDTLLVVRDEFGDTPSAARVPEAIATAFAAATAPYAEGRFCDALPALDYFAAVDPAAAGEVANTVATNRPHALLQCGLARLGAGDATANGPLHTFVRDYPQHPGLAQARSGLITAAVAAAAKVTLPVPPPLGGDSPGDIPVIFYNDSTSPLRIKVAGPTAHEISLPACAGCPASYPVGTEGCGSEAGLPSVTLRLTPAQYHYHAVWEDETIDEYVGSVTAQVDYEHSECLYIEE